MLPYINTYNYIFKIFFLHTENFNIFKFDFDLCEVKDVSDEYVITEKGLIDKDRFYIPKSRIIHIDGQFVWFGITKKDANQYSRN